MRMIDLSLTLEPNASERLPAHIQYVDHSAGALQMAAIFDVSPSELPDGLGWAGELVNLSTHTGTHMDAPWHYGPTCGGAAARFIGDIPLEWCLAPGIVLDFRDKLDGAEILVDDLRRSLAVIDHEIEPGEIVLLMTGADKYWGTVDYPERGPGLGREGVFWLADRGVRIIGIDAWGLDRSFSVMREDYRQSKDPNCIWSAHFAGRLREYCQLEKLTNLHLLPPTGFTLACFPIKVAAGSAGWCRVVAMLDESVSGWT